MEPVVSVIVVAMNDEAYIAETIESVLSQDYSNLQVHVQHGAGSTDNTLSIVRGYPLRWASELDTGFPDAANRGIRATDGEIVIVEGGDDPLLPGAIRALVDALQADPQAGFAYGDLQYIDARSNPFYVLRGRPLDLDELFWFNHVTSQSVAMRRGALVDSGMYRMGIINADWDLWVRMAARYPAVYIPKLLARYRVHPGSTSLNNLGKMASSMRIATDVLLADPAVVNRLRLGVKRAYAGTSLTAALLLIRAGRKRDAWGHFVDALKSYPMALTRWRGLITLAALVLGTHGLQAIRTRVRGDAEVRARSE
jgi:glycosyltransferase involved in cell wall biosynthesis